MQVRHSSGDLSGMGGLEKGDQMRASQHLRWNEMME